MWYLLMNGLIVSCSLLDIVDILVENYGNEFEEEVYQGMEEEQIDLGWEELQFVKKRKLKVVELVKEEFDEEVVV